MSEASDSQNVSEANVDLNASSSPKGNYYEGERSSLEFPKAATRVRKKRNSVNEDEDFVASEATSNKKKVVLAKEYGTSGSSRQSATAKERIEVRKVPVSKADKVLKSTTPKKFTLTIKELSCSKA